MKLSPGVAGPGMGEGWVRVYLVFRPYSMQTTGDVWCVDGEVVHLHLACVSGWWVEGEGV